jgi:hypothetical protein
LRELLLPREPLCVSQKEKFITVPAPVSPSPEPPSKALSPLPSQ